MIGVVTALMLLHGQTGGPAPDPGGDASSKVDSVTVTAAGKAAILPPWSREVRGIGWPFLGLGEDKTVMMFAKTGRTPTGSPYQRVWVRHEYRLPQTEAEAAPPLTYRSERLAQDIDCTARTFRSLAVYRYPENNLGGEETAFAFENRVWTKPEAGTFDDTVVEAACLTPDVGG